MRDISQKKVILCLLLLVCNLTGIAQQFGGKKLIGPEDYNKWYGIEDYAIDATGEFILYSIRNYPQGHKTLVVQLKNGAWKQQIMDAEDFGFDDHSQYLFYRIHDTLFLQQLNGSDKIIIESVESFQYKSGYIFAYIHASKDRKDLLLYNIGKQQKQIINNVDLFMLHNDGRQIVWVKPGQSASNLFMCDIEKCVVKKIYSGLRPDNITFDKAGEQLVFLVANTLWYYNSTSMDSAALLLDEQTEGIPLGFKLSKQEVFFNDAGNSVFFYIDSLQQEQQNNGGWKMYVWQYNARHLALENVRNNAGHYLCQLVLESGKVMQLESLNCFVVNPRLSNNNHFFLRMQRGVIEDYYKPEFKSYFELINTRSGKRTRIDRAEGKSQLFDVMISPNGKFLLGYDAHTRHYYSYEISTAQYRTITAKISFPVHDNETAKLEPLPFGRPVWIEDGDEVLIYDEFDIWLVSLKNEHPPVNVTKGQGRIEKVIWGISETEKRQIHFNEKILLSGFGKESKKNGFGWLTISYKGVSSFEPGEMNSHCYQIVRVKPVGSSFPSGFLPLKAKNKEVYLVSRMTASTSPNLFVTSDFKNYEPLTDIRPEKSYNWLTAEPVNFKLENGKVAQGILYKPENFKPDKKYPLIFTYYERRSDELHEYLVPKFSKGVIDIPSYVSNGYLVFVPDIYYKCGVGNGEGALKSVLASVKVLSRYKWFDANRLGLQGHSHGGSQTNYIITHSTLFAAACESAGSSNLISAYGQIQKFQGMTRQRGYEVGWQGCGLGIGQTPWTATATYIKYSPIFNVHKITTPLLILHNKNDDAVPFEQGLEMFLAMRRSGKKVWMLQYEDGEHLLYGSRSSEDFTRRMKQFFDHYLKGDPVADWMK